MIGWCLNAETAISGYNFKGVIMEKQICVKCEYILNGYTSYRCSVHKSNYNHVNGSQGYKKCVDVNLDGDCKLFVPQKSIWQRIFSWKK